MVIYIYCLFVELGKQKKVHLKTVLIQFGVLPTGSKVIIFAATWEAQRGNALAVSYLFYRVSYLALLTEIT